MCGRRSAATRRCPGSAELALGSPLFPTITIHLSDGKRITETAPAAAPGAPYIQHLTLNGASWQRAYLPGDIVTKGATLGWTLGTAPSSWGDAAGDAPGSDTQGLLPALGYLGTAGGAPS